MNQAAGESEFVCRFAQVELPASRRAPAQARRFVREGCRRWDLEDLADAASVLVSELVTNAVLHARSRSTLTLCVADGILEIAVRDRSTQLPVPEPAPDNLRLDGGRGLHIVDSIGDKWGAEPEPPGKATWVTVPARSDWVQQYACVCRQRMERTTASGRPVTHMRGPWDGWSGLT